MSHATNAPCPYPGLRAFFTDERDWYFGREAHVDAMLTCLEASRFLAVVGSSGSGKSSLVFAGLIPALREGQLAGSLRDAAGEAVPWNVVSFHPGNDSLAELAAAILKAAPKSEDPHLAGFIRAALDSGEGGLIEALRVAGVLNAQCEPLVYADQFEELFRFGEKSTRAAQENALRFARLFVAAGEQQDVRLHVLLSMRSEFIGECERFPGLPEIVSRSQFLTPRLSRKQLEQSLGCPAEAVGWKVAPDALTAILNDCGNSPDQLPLAQHVLRSMWMRAAADGRNVLTLDDYTRVGGIRDSIARHGQAILDKLPQVGGPDVARILFMALCDQREEGPLVRRLSSCEEVKALAGEHRGLVPDVIAAFGGDGPGFIREDNGTLDVRHEAVLRQWPLIAEWRLREADSVKWLRDLAESAKDIEECPEETALWQGNDLRRAEEWKRKEKPSGPWAERHSVKNWDQCLRFLAASRLEADRASRRNRALKFVALLLALVVIGISIALFVMNKQKDEMAAWQRGGLLDELRGKPEQEQRDLAPSRFDMLAAYYLWEAPMEDSMGRLRQALQNYESLLPEDYGLPPGEDAPPPPTDSPIEIRYADDRSNDEAGFVREWRRLAKNVTKQYGFPVPARVPLVPVPELRGDSVIAQAPGMTDVRFDVPRDQGKCLVILSNEAKELPPRVLAFHNCFKKEWEILKQSEDSTKTYWIVPRWSLPVWKACNRTVTSGSGIFAFRVMQHLLEEEPQVIVSQKAVDVLLREVAKSFPTTVAEARAAHKDIAADLAILVRKKTPLSILPEILEGVAERWDLEPDEIAKEFTRSWRKEEAQIPDRLHGPWKDPNGGGPQSESVQGDSTAYTEALPYLPPIESPIRVSVGNLLVTSWFPERVLPEAIANAIEVKLKSPYYRRRGVWLPGVTFRDGWNEVPESSVCIELMDQRVGEGGPVPITLDGPDTFLQFLKELESAVDVCRSEWNTMERVGALLEDLPVGLRDWLKRKYSVTDLNILLRGVMAPEKSRSSAYEATARYPDWLLASLVGWATLGDPLNTKEMRDHLLDTQQARLNSGPPAGAPTNEAAEVEAGVRALQEDRIDEAVRSFENAKRADPSAARKVFLQAWTEAFPQAWVRFFEIKHPDLDELQLSPTEKLDLEDVLAVPETKSSADAHWRALLYSFAATERGEERSRLMREILNAPAAAKYLTPANARWLALKFLREYSATPDPPKLFETAAALLESAINRLNAKERLSAFIELQKIATDSAADKRLWDLVANLAANTAPDVQLSVQLEFASTLCSRERKEDAERGLILVADYERLLERAPTSEDLDRAWKQRYIGYLKACAHDNLSRIGEPRGAKAERLYQKALGPIGGKRDEIARSASFDLIALLQDQDRLDDADAMLRDARRDWPDDAGFQSLALVSAFARGDADGVCKVSRDALAKADELEKKLLDAKDWLAPATWGMLTTRMEGWEKVAERYAEASKINAGQQESILLHLAVNRAEVEPDRAPALLEHWKGVDPSSWERRLREGDALVFNEMLVGRWIERPESKGLLDLLDSEDKWKKSALPNLSSPRHEQRSEAWLLEASRAAAAGNTKGRLECLRHCVEAHATSNWEYWEALFLLAQEPAR